MEDQLFIGAPTAEDINEYPFHDSAELLSQPVFEIPDHDIEEVQDA